jgi:2-dehydro-3-deoxyphosphogluconate aldolase/(4S)-4-hydroxy-2-oxoglutarate aldolase
MNQFSWQLFNQIPVIGIMRNVPQQHIATIAGVFQSSGLSNLEITMNSAGASETIALLVKLYGDKLNIGAGTVCTMADLEQALSAGAQFIVTPVTDEEVIKTCVAKGIPIFPGAFTPTEIYKAWNMGASMVKVFPATTMGPGYIKEVLGPLNHIKLAPTGGINPDNFIEYFKAGAKAVGMGGHLFPKSIIDSNDWDKLAATYTQLLHTYQSFMAVG